ncbi:MAG: ATP cone domain-containing protein, partial [Betaproteobacteria bacterium]|nr:ATP cone domain-containing protein [Betaproteobacteria bacterium]
MKCPRCGSNDTKVQDSRPGGKVKYRRRMCKACDFRFSTTELHGRHRAEQLPLLPDYLVSKRGGQTEEFDREKLRKSLGYAGRRGKSTAETIDACVDRVTERLYQQDAAKIASSQIIKWVLDLLMRKDVALA